MRSARHHDEPRPAIEFLARVHTVQPPRQVDAPRDPEEPATGGEVQVDIVTTETVVLVLADLDSGDPIGEVEVERITAMDWDFGDALGVRRVVIDYG